MTLDPITGLQMHYSISLAGYVPALKQEREYSLQRLFLLNKNHENHMITWILKVCNE